MHWKTVIVVCFALISGFVAGKYIEFPLTKTLSAESKSNNTFTIANCVSEFQKANTLKTKRGWQYWFVPKELTGNLNLKMSYVEARQANHPPHTHSEGEIFYILAGQAEFNLNGESKNVPANTSLFCPPGIAHGIRNSGDAPLQYLVIKNN